MYQYDQIQVILIHFFFMTSTVKKGSKPHPLHHFQELHLKIRGEHLLAHCGLYFIESPETAAVEFIAWCDSTVIHSTIYIDQFPLAFTFKEIAIQKARFAICYSKFLAHLSNQRRRDFLAIVDMAADSRIPFVGLYGFPCRAVLQV